MITFLFNGQQIEAEPGATIGAALLNAGIRELRSTRFDQQPRGLFCAIGSCFDCVVTIDGVANRRACITPVASGMVVTSD